MTRSLHQLPGQAPARRLTSPAYTLVEMMVVLGIIVLILATAVPVINSMVAGNALASSQNLIAATIANARADAISQRMPIGVCFYVDVASGRTAMQEVQQIPLAYTSSAAVTATSALYSQAGGSTAVQGLEAVYTLQSINNGNTTQTIPIYYRDPVLLPGGIAVALCNDCLNSTALDRYVRVGVIMFDATGTLTTTPYGISEYWEVDGTNKLNTQLGTKLGLNQWSNSSSNNNIELASGITATTSLMSQTGLAIYDHDAYRSQLADVYDTDNPADRFSDADLEYAYPDPANPAGNSPLLLSTTQEGQKEDEEAWIDANSTQLMVSPYNGSLIYAK